MIVENNLHVKLIKKIKQGSYEDFTRLYFIYAHLLYGFILKLTKDPNDLKIFYKKLF